MARRRVRSFGTFTPSSQPLMLRMQPQIDSADRRVPKGTRSPSILVSKRNAKLSMHRALLMPEIVRLIFTFVRGFDEAPTNENFLSQPMAQTTPGKSTLASLARTCRAWHDPAIDELWMHLDTLDPLIKLLPCRMWAKKHIPPMVGRMLPDGLPAHGLTRCERSCARNTG